MTRLCPAGHDSTAEDYCDTCGVAMPAPGSAPAAPVAAAASAAPAATGECPHCSTVNVVDALFCEACGYDFTTGTLPRPVTPASTLPDVPATGGPTGAAAGAPVTANPSPPPADTWVAEVWIDPDWYADQQSTDPLPSPGLPTVVALRHTSVLVGRTSRSRGITPEIDLATDNGTSRRHAQLTTDGTRWFVEDLGSANGTYVGGAVGALPTVPVPVGQKREIGPDDRVYVGAWTRIVVRRAAPGEV